MADRPEAVHPVIPGTCAVLAVGIVLVAAGGFIPREFVPRAPAWVIAAIPHINVLIAVLAIATIGYGWRAIRHQRIATHRRAMSSALLLFATFLVLYLYRLTVLGGPSSFQGPSVIYRFVYLPILIVHIGLAILCIPLVFDALALGLTVSPSRLRQTRHPTVGRAAATLWLISFTLGIAVYLLVHWV